MEHIKVTSSNGESYSYDPATKTLEVRFKGKNGEPGNLYAYSDVKQEIVDALLQHPSFGQGLNLLVKGKHDFKKIG